MSQHHWPQIEVGPSVTTAGANQEASLDTATNTTTISDDRLTGSQQVSWTDVHWFVTPRIAVAGPYPMVGTPAWCALADTDSRKWVALLSAAEHWALRVETCQIAECAAAQAISAGTDWGQIARSNRQRSDWIKAHPWSRRVVA